MASAHDDPERVRVLFDDYERATDLVHKRRLLSEMHACYQVGLPGELWLLLGDARALAKVFCKALQPAERLIIATAQTGGFPSYRCWLPESRRSIGPRLWGRMSGPVYYPVDWDNSTVSYVRFEVSPYSFEGVIIETIGEYLPAERFFQIELVRLPLRHVLAMLHGTGLLPSLPRIRVTLTATNAPDTANITAPITDAPVEGAATDSEATKATAKLRWVQERTFAHGSPPPSKKRPTLSHRMIIAIARRDFRGRHQPRIADIHRHITANENAVWKAECIQQGLKEVKPGRYHLGPPSRDTIARALRNSSSIK